MINKKLLCVIDRKIFLKNLIKLLSGSAIAQLIQFMTIPFFSRVYDPSDFALLAQVQAISIIFVILLTLQMHLYIPLSKSQTEADDVLKVIQLTSLGLFIIFCAISLYIGKGDYILAAFLIIFLGLSNTYNSYLVYKGAFNRISFFSIFRALLIVSLQSLFYHIKFKEGLVCALIIGEGTTALGLLFIVGSYKKSYSSNFYFKTCILYIKKLKSFTLFGTLQELLAVSTFYLPILMASHKFSMNLAGQYATSSRLVWAPTILFTGTLVQVISHQLGEMSRNSINIEDNYILVDKKKIIVACMICLGCFFFRDIFVVILGDKWTEVMKIIPILVIWCAFYFFSIKARVICRFFQLQKKCVIIELITLIFLLLTYAFPNISIMTFVGFVVIIGILQNIMILLLVYNYLRAKHDY